MGAQIGENSRISNEDMDSVLGVFFICAFGFEDEL